MYIFSIFLYSYLTGLISSAKFSFSSEPVVIAQNSNVPENIVLELHDSTNNLRGRLRISFSHSRLDVNIPIIQVSQRKRDAKIFSAKCFYNVILLNSELFGEMIHGSYTTSVTDGQVSICEGGLWGYVNLPPSTRFPNGAVLWIQPSLQPPAVLEMKLASKHQIESQHQITIIPTANPANLPTSPSNSNPHLTKPEQFSVRALLETVNNSLSRQKRSADPVDDFLDIANPLSSIAAPTASISLNSGRFFNFTSTRQNRDPDQPLIDPVRVYHQPKHPEGPNLVELYMIADQAFTAAFRGHYDRLVHRVNKLVTLVNGLYTPFNILIVVVRLEIWEQDQITINGPEHHLLNALATFKRMYVTVRHDCLHALLGIRDAGSRTRGDSEGRSICTYSTCVAYSRDSPTMDVTETARAMAHEFGHNLGLRHDTEECQCQSCIMATGIEFGTYLLEWSLCSVRDLKSLLEYGMARCLRDKPTRGRMAIDGQSSLSDDGNIPNVVHFYNGSKAGTRLPNRRSTYQRNGIGGTRYTINSGFCGNGQLDLGEECDCGTRTSCPVELQSCCDVDRCLLKAGSECAGGPCCLVERLSTQSSNSKANYQCRIKLRGTVCRSEAGDCDLPEYCDGQSQWCPADVYKADGISCTTKDGRKSHCARGGCREADSWCRVLWGHTGRVGHADCFTANLRPNDRNEVDSVANCGIKRPPPGDRWQGAKSWPGIPCPSWQDAECGRLWCHHRNEKPMLLGWIKSDYRPLPSTGRVCSALVYDPVWPASDASLKPTLNGTQRLLPTAASVGMYSMVTQDAGMVPDGTPCSRGLCYNGSCVPPSKVRALTQCECGSHGVCNNLGHCHCPAGFHPPFCDFYGDGGSVDSGPPPHGVVPDPNLIIGLTLFVVIIAPTVILSACWYVRTGCVRPKIGESVFIPTKTGLVKPFDEGLVHFFRQCCRARITNKSPTNYSLESGMPNNGSDSRSSGWANGNLLKNAENGHIGKSGREVCLSSVNPINKGWIPTFLINHSYYNVIKNNTTIDRSTNNNIPRVVSPASNGPVDSRRGVSLQVEWKRSTAHDRLTMQDDAVRGISMNNDCVVQELNSKISTFYESQSRSSVLYGKAAYPSNADKSRIQSLSIRSEIPSEAAAMNIPLISEPLLNTMTYRGKTCSLENARMFALHQNELANHSFKTPKSRNLIRRATEFSKTCNFSNTIRTMRPKPNVNRSQSQRPILSPNDISYPKLEETTYTEDLADLKTALLFHHPKLSNGESTQTDLRLPR